MVAAKQPADERAHINVGSSQRAGAGGDGLEQGREHRRERVDEPEVRRLGRAVAEDERRPLGRRSAEPQVA
ncbi:MAG TPA: hypothetical protein VK631_18510 [Solirubrobacteraceae bacterium]|nr:hypothetical protein [Solirubrobacteraceae bacterium]